MISFFRRLFGRPREPLSRQSPELQGAPARRRIKTFAAESGHSYQYFYKGFRDTAGQREFVFGLIGAADRSVVIAEDEVDKCSRLIGRDFAAQERYAVAKMALFAGFDDEHMEREIRFSPSASQMMEYLRQLGRL